ncbi:hypothetical protein QOZ80_7AG0566240 [Eleusine coracana subsp. coracana]|nr:hypothetical protein QOZ80_7AG0566230 [Eleusine coracana subsp. coracana]KAK3126972.1 hypothetical protein QOZ80_7AG0566240 [Eleusine coracana subsp. coracana]
MAPSKTIVALFLALTLVANTLQPSEAIRVVQAAASADQEAPEKTAAASSTNADAYVAKPSAPSAAGQVPGFPFPLLPFPLFPLPGGGAPPAGQFPGFPFPLFPLPGGAPPAGQAPAFPFPLFPPLFPMPGAPPAGQGQLPGFPFPLLPPLFPLPGFPRPGSPPPPSSTATKLSVGETVSPRPQVTDCLPPLMTLTPCMDYLTDTSVPAPPSTCCDGFRTLVNDAPICLCHGLNGDINKIMPAPMDLMRMMSLPATCRVALPLQTLPKCSVAPVPPLTMPAPAPGPVTAPSPAPSP